VDTRIRLQPERSPESAAAITQPESVERRPLGEEARSALSAVYALLASIAERADRRGVGERPAEENGARRARP
jgi:hypothetical protein